MERVRPPANALDRHRPRARLAQERRLRALCAPGSTFRKRGEGVRSRTTSWAALLPTNGSAPLVDQAMASREKNFAGRWHRSSRTLWPSSCQHQACGSRLDGLDGTGATLSDVAGLAGVMRGKDSPWHTLAEIQFRLSLPPDQQFSRRESAHVASPV